MCDRKATSREHVPPRCLFPELKDLPVGFDFRKNLVSVPSCAAHNSEKSKDDEFLMFLLSTAQRGNIHKQRHFSTKVLRAYRSSPSSYEAFMEKRRPIVLQREDGSEVVTAAFEVNLERFNACMHHIACGLFFHHTRDKWLGESRVVTDAFASLTGPNSEEVHRVMRDGTRQIATALEATERRGENGSIFQYKIHTAGPNTHAIHLLFYEGIQIAVLFHAA